MAYQIVWLSWIVCIPILGRLHVLDRPGKQSLKARMTGLSSSWKSAT